MSRNAMSDQIALASAFDKACMDNDLDTAKLLVEQGFDLTAESPYHFLWYLVTFQGYGNTLPFIAWLAGLNVVHPDEVLLAYVEAKTSKPEAVEVLGNALRQLPTGTMLCSGQVPVVDALKLPVAGWGQLRDERGRIAPWSSPAYASRHGSERAHLYIK